MANSPVDKSQDFIESGMTLITEHASEKYLKKSKERKKKNESSECTSDCFHTICYNYSILWFIQR